MEGSVNAILNGVAVLSVISMFPEVLDVLFFRTIVYDVVTDMGIGLW